MIASPAKNNVSSPSAATGRLGERPGVSSARDPPPAGTSVSRQMRAAGTIPARTVEVLMVEPGVRIRVATSRNERDSVEHARWCPAFPSPLLDRADHQRRLHRLIRKGALRRSYERRKPEIRKVAQQSHL